MTDFTYRNGRWHSPDSYFTEPTLRRLLFKMYHYGFTWINVNKHITVQRNNKIRTIKIPSDLFSKSGICKIKQRNRYIKTDPITGIKYL
jgi:hypothetical protein